MKAVLINEDKSLRYDNVPNPIVKSDECLIKVEAAALNRADLMQREGNYPPPPGAPEWMGLEVAGTIIEMGEVAREKSTYKIGDKVCALLGGGGYAEMVSVKHDMCMPIPKSCSVIEAAAIPEAFATAYLNLFMEGGIKEGDTLLMHAGASGLASVIIPMAKAFGIRVITSVRAPEFKEKIAHLGADIVVDTSCEDIVEVLKRELAEGRGVDVAIDCLGSEIMGKYLHYLKHGARWIMIAAPCAPAAPRSRRRFSQALCATSTPRLRQGLSSPPSTRCFPSSKPKPHTTFYTKAKTSARSSLP